MFEAVCILSSESLDEISVHILSGDLIMHKLTLEPIKSLIYNLRRYDVHRCVAMGNHIKAEAEWLDEDDSGSDAQLYHYRAPYTPKRTKTKSVASALGENTVSSLLIGNLNRKQVNQK